MTVADPIVLLALWAVALAVVLWRWMHRRARARLARIVIAARRDATADRRFDAQLALSALGAALAVVAAARPRWGEREEVVLAKGRNVVIAIDVSRSMLAEDVRPNRLERARADVRDLLADLRGDRAGLLAFRNGAVLVCPLTTDTAFLRQALEGLSVDSAPRGATDLGGAVDRALEALEPFPGDHNAIVLISDGEDLEGRAVEAARRAGERGVPIFTVGIGGMAGAPIPIAGNAFITFRGEQVVTRLDNQTLLDMAAASGGAYIPLQTAGTGRVTLGTLYHRYLRGLAAQELQARRERRQVERYQWFLIPALGCFLGAAFLSTGRPRRGPRASAALARTALLWLTLGGLVRADGSPAAEPRTAQGRDLARSAQRAFRAGKFDVAADAFLEAAAAPALAPSVAAAFRFNAALAQWHAGAMTNAAATFREVLRQDGGLHAAHDGLGATLFEAATAGAQAGTNALTAAQRVQLLDEAAEAFQESLRALPLEDTRRRNLAAVAARLPELREEAHHAAILERHGRTPPEELLAAALRGQRTAYRTAAAALTNDAPAQIAQFEDAARAQDEAADLWIALAPRLLEAFGASVTNQQQLAQIQHQLGGARARRRQATAALRDLDPAGLDAVARQEQETLGLFALVASPPPMLDEAILAQTNALRAAATPESPRTPALDQAMARELTRRFQERFPAWADALTAAAAEAPPEGGPIPTTLTAEQRAEIERLAEETLQLQDGILAAPTTVDGRLSDETMPQRVRVQENLLRIRELLPKSSAQSQESQESQESQASQASEDPSAPATPPPDRGADENAAPQPPEDPATAESPEEQAPLSEAAPEDKDPEESALRELMDRVLRREREREEERQRRLQQLPPLLHERDW